MPFCLGETQSFPPPPPPPRIKSLALLKPSLDRHIGLLNESSFVCLYVCASVPDSVRQQYQDNCTWIREAGKQQLVGATLHRLFVYCKSDQKLDMRKAGKRALYSPVINAVNRLFV